MRRAIFSRIVAVACLMLIVLTVYSLVFRASNNKDTLSAQEGRLDLSTRDLSADGAVYLGGEWEFYYRQFLDPRLPVSTSADGYIDVPELWNSFQVNGEEIGSEGYGTYRLRVALPEVDSVLGLKIPSMSSCYRLYANGTLISANGSPGASAETEIPQWKPGTAFLATGSTDLELIVHVSNFHHVKGGMWGQIMLGEQEEIIRYRDLSLSRSYLLFGMLVISAFFMLSLSLVERNFTYFSLGLFCLFSGLREITVRDVAIWNIAGQVSFDQLSKLEYLTMPCAVLFLTLFMRDLYRQTYNRRVCDAICLSSSLLIMLAILAPTRVFSLFLAAYIANALIALAYAAFAAARACLRGQPSAEIGLVGAVILLLATINDTLNLGKITNSYGAAHSYAIAFSLFLLSQLYIVFSNIAGNYQQATRAVQSQLLLLQSQIKPHFLYNVLTTVQYLIDESPEKAKRLLIELVEYLRGKFKYGFDTDVGLIPLWKELDLVESYVYMSNARFGDRIDLRLEVEDGCLEQLIPAFFVQPLVENSVVHGLGEGQLAIDISVRRTDHEMIVTVQDDGVGIGRIELQSLFADHARDNHTGEGNGIGLRNIRRRMQLYYRRDIAVSSEKGQGTTVTLAIPLKLESPGEVKQR